MTTAIRPPALAGTWYPADPDALRRSVEAYLDGADPAAAPPGRPVVVVVPHAGHQWSGATAGRVYGLLRRTDYDRIVLLAPNHRAPLTTPSCPDHDAYATPLGAVGLDVNAREALVAAGIATLSPGAHAQEHAEEIQLPFLQALWPDTPPVLPILVPHLDDEARTRTAAAMAPWCDGRTLWIVSTDFTHYGRDFGYLPFVDDVARRLEKLDHGAIDRILAWDAQGLLDYGRETGITMCGLEAMALALIAPWPAMPHATLVDYARSGDRDEDYTFSVSYAGLLATLPDPDGEPRP